MKPVAINHGKKERKVKKRKSFYLKSNTFLNSNFERLGNLYLHLKIQKDVYLISRMLII